MLVLGLFFRNVVGCFFVVFLYSFLKWFYYSVGDDVLLDLVFVNLMDLKWYFIVNINIYYLFLVVCKIYFIFNYNNKYVTLNLPS